MMAADDGRLGRGARSIALCYFFTYRKLATNTAQKFAAWLHELLQAKLVKDVDYCFT